MNWLNDPKYNEHRREGINYLKRCIRNPSTLRRVERQIYNVATLESEVSSWGNEDYINNYFDIIRSFVASITKQNIDVSSIDNKVLYTRDITAILGYDNYRYILSDIVEDNMPFHRKNIILSIYERLLRIRAFDLLNSKDKIFMAVDIEKSCYDSLNKSIIENQYDEYHHKEEILHTYEYITSQVLTYIDIHSDDKSEYVINNISNPDVYKKIGFMTPEDLFPEKFQPIKDEIEYRQNITVMEKISTEYTCKVCKASMVTIKGIQTRSLDEGETLYAKCVKCNNKWRLT
jgi:DNA-directed RNA polymerase subunit M/transcription elongation factor TFIIS